MDLRDKILSTIMKNSKHQDENFVLSLRLELRLGSHLNVLLVIGLLHSCNLEIMAPHQFTMTGRFEMIFSFQKHYNNLCLSPSYRD